jgi:hypothetical protein
VVDAPTIPIPDMAARLAADDADALLPDGVPGPVRLAGQWWAVPTGHHQYQPVTDPAAATLFNEGLARLAAHRAHRANLITRTGQQRR